MYYFTIILQFPTANLSAVFLNILYYKLSMHEIILRQYNEFKGKKYFGTYWPASAQPILTLRDLDIVQQVLSKHETWMLKKVKVLLYLTYFFSTVKDFDNFTDRSFSGLLWDKGTSKNDIIWNTSLFTIKGGNNWRLVRQTLNPAFTLSKMKMMLQVSTFSHFFLWKYGHLMLTTFITYDMLV